MTEQLYIFFDTETTGVPLNYKAPTTDTRNWPRLVQLGWILMDNEGNKLSQKDYIIRPEGFTIPVDASRIHGITTARALEEGQDLKAVIEEFMVDIDKATYIVGHNVDFDKKIVGAELVRLHRQDIMSSKRTYCTMQAGTNFCQIPGRYGYKWPKLQELYVKLFGHEFDGAHNAMSDIDATQECFWEMRRRKLI
ncbi:MAG: 3'-5' exonuclease [Prevotella sp.]|nr:3'-5' exonuclease [Prevotella sp.]